MDDVLGGGVAGGLICACGYERFCWGGAASEEGEAQGGEGSQGGGVVDRGWKDREEVFDYGKGLVAIRVG